jgi:hypothetical protein|tara:strand:+ start:32535 stop:33635 length:1101 start_codon:yes stop_codon:yes gene_type:complete
MTNNPPIADRIAAALTMPGPAADIPPLIDEARSALQAAEKVQTAARKRALDPVSGAKEASVAREEAEAARFEVERFEQCITSLTNRHKRLSTQESEAAREAEERETLKECDALVKDLREQVPPAIDTLVKLNVRIRELNEKMKRLRFRNEEFPEPKARDLPGNMYKNNTPIMKLTDIRLPDFYGTTNLWPIDYQRLNAIEHAKTEEARRASAEASRAAAKAAERTRWQWVMVDNNQCGFAITGLKHREGEFGVRNNLSLFREMDEAQIEAARKAGCNVSPVAEKSWTFKLTNPAGGPYVPIKTNDETVQVSRDGLSADLTREQLADAREAGVTALPIQADDDEASVFVKRAAQAYGIGDIKQLQHA